MTEYAVAGRPYKFTDLTPDERQDIIDRFHQLWYDEAMRGLTWGSTGYFGVGLSKMPSDLWLYQQLIYQIRPALLIETGTFKGGSALYFAHLFDQYGHGRVITIDLAGQQRNYPRHPRIEYLSGHSSVAKAVVAQVHERVDWLGGPVMVVLDSDHSMDHVLRELNAYAGFVTPGSYLVVEDTNVNAHPVFASHGPGPFEAVESWLPRHPEFVLDGKVPAQMLFSMHGWLRRERE